MMTAAEVRERPILFSGEMVRAILDGSKTQTRRVVKPQPEAVGSGWMWPSQAKWEVMWTDGSRHIADLGMPDFCPYGQPGDRLWVRETWGWDEYDDGNGRAWKRPVYRADPGAQPLDNGSPAPWKPSIHMPRRLSRITLEITDVRVERVQEISEEDARAEGAAPIPCDPASIVFSTWKAQHRYRDGFRSLWDQINGPRGFGWCANPWVWVVSFRRIDQ